MPEKEEKKVNLNQKKEKPSLWQKIKKPLAAGILAAGLLMSPGKRAEGAGIEYVLAPPEKCCSSYIEKRWKIGWRMLLKGWNRNTPADQAEVMYNAALNYFKRQLEKAKEKGIEHEIISAKYLYTWTIYASAALELTLKETEDRMLKALELAEERLKEAPDDFDFVDLKLMIYYNLAVMYAQVALNDSSEVAQLNIKYRTGGMPIKECEKRAIEYSKKYLDFYKKVIEKIKESKIYAFSETPDVLSEASIKDFNDGYKQDKERIEKYLKQLNPE